MNTDRVLEFTNTVKNICQHGNLSHVVIYDDTWPEMYDASWREAVLNELAMPSLFQDVTFMELDVRGWIFQAVLIKGAKPC